MGKSDSIYFIMVDRFVNGDPKNDIDVDVTDPQGWHGGDLLGVKQQLDYIQNLGFNTIWLSPIFLTRSAPFFGHGAFHGYWSYDVGELDPRFGSEAELVSLSKEVHRRGMKLILDMVVNHVGFDAPRLITNPDWFHQYPKGESAIKNWDNAKEIITHEVHGLPDLAQENPEVFKHLLNAAKKWRRLAAIDGLRLDAVKHVSTYFWKKYNAALKKDGMNILLGEHYHGSVSEVAQVQKTGRFSHMFDFPLAFALRDTFCPKNTVTKILDMGGLGAVLSQDKLYPNANNLVTFVDNHDIARIASRCAEDIDRLKSIYTAQYVLRGIPSLTWGSEYGATGEKEPSNRSDFNSIIANGRIENSNNTLLRHIQKIQKLRHKYPVLQQGKTNIIDYQTGLLHLVRYTKDTIAAIVFNGTTSAKMFSAKMLAPNANLLHYWKQPLSTLKKGNKEDKEDREDREQLNNNEIGQDVLAVSSGEVGVFISRLTQPYRAHEDLVKITIKLHTKSHSKLQTEFNREQERATESKESKETKSLQYLLVGSGKPMGFWDPYKSKVLFKPYKKNDGVQTLTITAPAGTLMAYKVVAMGKIQSKVQSKIQWESRSNRYLFFAPRMDRIMMSGENSIIDIEQHVSITFSHGEMQ